MSYKLYVKKGMLVFDKLVKMIAYTRIIHGGGDRIELTKVIYDEFSIRIEAYDPNAKSTPVDFGSEQNYMLFLLRW